MNKQEYLTRIEKEKEELEINSKLGEEELWVCSECGSLDIEEKMWVKVNNGEITDSSDDGVNLNCFCNECNTHTTQITLKGFLRKYD